MRLIARFKQYLFRWRSDGTAPLRLGQRRIFIVPSRGGLLFALALVVMLLGAINYNLALGHALVFLLAGLGIAGMIHTFRNLFGLVITPGHCEPVFAGQTAFFPLALDNDRRAPRLALELAAQAGLPVETAIDSLDQTRIRVPLQAGQRGWLPLPRVRLSTRYPLGLFTAWAYLQPEMRCLVYPQPIAAPLPVTTPAHNNSMRHGEGGQEDFAGFRTRQPADSLRHVAWKASARNGGEGPLLVKEFAGGAESELIVDWQLTDPALPTDSRLGVLTGWILAAEAERTRYGLRLPGLALPPASGDLHRRRCLEALALFQP
ncbi:DUF58 domain-containing protein [Dechloromonas sp. XY25]|uniref:DUF58 domain-containing protein n=1 Tax=Dechloromonas hankyongensis TaxID=2908002 RepID=A0ABS9K3R4_9RHOO|nr:DUF58 domain-containing protein [Dechloromonas hankyongensis]MCG2577812.1 DUF58 domain-containing protein [Dechloromonas hankyongensis]